MNVRTLLAIALATLLFTDCSGAEINSLLLPTPTPQTPHFATPEAAIEHYMQGVRNADAATILEATGIEERASQFRFEDNAERLGAFVPFSPAPAEYPFFADINAAANQAAILNQVKMLAYSLLSSEAIDGSPVTDFDADRARAFVADVDPARLSGIQVVAIEDPLDSFGNDPERARELFSRAAAVYGADEMVERMVVLAFEGRTWLTGFTLFRYGDDWKINTQTSNIAGTSALGTATEVGP